MSIDFFLEPESLRDAVFDDEHEARIADTVWCSRFRHAIDDISELYEIPYLTVRSVMIEAREQSSTTIYGLCELAAKKSDNWISRKLKSLQQSCKS